MYQIEKSLKPRIGHFGKTCTLPLYKGWSRTTSSEGFVATETRSCTEGINQLFLINARSFAFGMPMMDLHVRRLLSVKGTPHGDFKNLRRLHSF